MAVKVSVIVPVYQAAAYLDRCVTSLLEQTLPDEFIRCHRAFIVRRSRISCIRLSQNCLTLDNGETLPLSRTYKPRLKGLLP